MKYARLGIKARWYCKGCTVRRYQGRFPCTDCCGWTASAGQVARGVLTAHGQLNARCLP